MMQLRVSKALNYLFDSLLANFDTRQVQASKSYFPLLFREALSGKF